MKFEADVRDSSRKKVLKLYQEAIKSVLPRILIKKNVRLKKNKLKIGGQEVILSQGKLMVIGGGKASADMAAALEEIIPLEKIHFGLVNSTRKVNTKKITIHPATHPIPSKSSSQGVRQMLDATKNLSPQDTVICLISGGGSSILPLPTSDIPFKDIQETTNILIKGGAEVYEMQYLRKHISRVKGGQLARHIHPARIITLMISDVINPDDVTAAGPTEPDDSTYQDAYKVITKYRLQNKISPHIVKRLKKGVAGELRETPDSTDSIFETTHNIVMGNYDTTHQAVARKAKNMNLQVQIRKKPLLGNIKKAANTYANELKTISHKTKSGPILHIASSEITVEVKGGGKGGRCQEFSARVAAKLADSINYTLLAAGTDGVDFIPGIAGTITDQNTHSYWSSQGMDIADYLADNNTHALHDNSNTLIHGPMTGTNVGDLYLCLLE